MCLSLTLDSVMRCEEDAETNGCPCFFRLYGGEERRGSKNAGNITLASPPSRRFLTRPHCVLLPPIPSSLTGPHQLGTRLLLWLFFLPLNAPRVTQAPTQEFISPRWFLSVVGKSHIYPFHFNYIFHSSSLP